MKPPKCNKRGVRGAWFFTMLLAVCLVPGMAQATDYYVSTSGDDSTGASWAEAFHTVGAALDKAQQTDTIRVAAGTYMENITMKDAVTLFGGYVFNGTSWERNWINHNTILDGNHNGNSVVEARGTKVQGVLDGFTIRNGGNGGTYGGGIKIVDASPWITNNYVTDNDAKVGGGIYGLNYNGGRIESNTIFGNRAGWHGGGIHLTESSVEVVNNIIESNRTRAAGGGIYLTANIGTNGQIKSNTILNNSSGSGGGGLFIKGSDTPIAQNYIINNTTRGAGGGIYLNDYNGTVVNCMITENHGEKGGGIYAGSDTGSIVLSFNTIAYNTSDKFGPGIIGFTNSMTVRNSIVWHNTFDFYGNGGITYTTICNGTVNNVSCPPEEIDDITMSQMPLFVDISDSDVSDSRYENSVNNVISADPQFVGSGDYHLLGTSPCVDLASAVGVPSVDIDGESRPVGGGYDIGADEVVDCEDTDGDGYYNMAGCPGSLGVDCNDGDPNINPGATEVCDNVDNDCNGSTDEDYIVDESCFLPGACAAENVASSCVDGVETLCSTGIPAADDASCNNIDDDCDGSTDEDYIVDESCFLPGACAAENVASSCVAGAETLCSTGIPAADDATCDGVDDDCDGSTDEDYASVSTTCGIGACAATGATSCVAGSVGDSCTPGTPAADDATCDGVDDDCDGVNDEDYAPVPTTCGVGACESTGVTSCVGGVVEESSCTPGTPGPEECNNAIDDDCDGSTDEGMAEDALTIRDAIDALPCSVFKRGKCRYRILLHLKLTTVYHMIRAAENMCNLPMLKKSFYHRARMKLQKDILKRINGCHDNNPPAPDTRDWIQTCETPGQNDVDPLVRELIADLDVLDGAL